MDGGKLLEYCVEEIDLDGVKAKAITREAEVVSVAAHAIYKEHMYLLADYFTIKRWISGKAIRLAEEHKVEDSISIALKLNQLLENGVLEAPIKLDIGNVMTLYTNKFIEDNIFRATSINLIKYLKRGDIGKRLLSRVTRLSY